MPTKVQTKLSKTKEKVTEEKKVEIKIKKAPIFLEKTQAHLNELSKEFDCPVLVYFKPPSGNIWSQDLYAIMQCLKVVGKTKKLAVYIRSDGGNGMVSLRIIHLLRSFTEELILLAPSECASAATMLALGCEEIHMGPLSSLSPVDSSLTHALSPVDNLNKKVSISLEL
jgi:ClpP class serine protease